MKMKVAILFLVACSTAAAADSTIEAGQVYEAILSPVLQALAAAAATVITAAAALAVAWLKKRLNLSDAEAEKLGLELDAQRRDALHTAITNGAGVFIARGGAIAKGVSFDVRSPAMVAAVDYVTKSAPDALKHFDLDGQFNTIAEKIVAKLPQMQQAQQEAK